MKQIAFVLLMLWPWTLAAASSPLGRFASEANQCDWDLMVWTPGRRPQLRTNPPTHISIMSERYWDLENDLAGYRETGIPLVAKMGELWGPGGGADDVGLYYFVPKIAVRTGWSLARSIDVFLASMLVLGLALGTVGFLLYFRRWVSRAVAALALLGLALIVGRFGDVYIAQFTTSAVVVPWTLYFCKQSGNRRWLPIALLVGGILIGTAGYIRSYSGTAALLFLLPMCVFAMEGSRLLRAFLLVCVGAGMLVPNVMFHNALARREGFLAQTCPQYPLLQRRHVLWHAVYLGFGYLQNDLGIQYKDEDALQRALTVAPGTEFYSEQYEHVLRNEVLGLILHHPLFVFMTVASKAGVALGLTVAFANIGLPLAVYWRKPWPIDLAFWAAMAFSALPGLLVIPRPTYLVGLMSFAALYGVVSIGFAIEGSRETSADESVPCPASFGRSNCLTQVRHHNRLIPQSRSKGRVFGETL